MKSTQKKSNKKQVEEKKKVPEVKIVEEKKPVLVEEKVQYSPRLQELQVSKQLMDKIQVIYNVLSEKCSYEEILHSLKESDYDEQTVINNYFEGKITWKEVQKKDKKEKKRPENKNKFKKTYDKKKKEEPVVERKIEKKEKKQQSGPTIKSYVQPEIEESSKKSLSYSQIVQEKPKLKVKQEEKVEQHHEEEEEEEEHQQEEEEEEEEQQQQVDLNTSYDDFTEDTVILPDSTKEFFIDDLQFGSLNISEKDSKKSKESSWDFQNQDTKKKQKFVPNQQPYFPNQFYSYPYMMPPNMQFQNTFRYQQQQYGKNPNMFYGSTQQQQQYEEMMQHYYQSPMMQQDSNGNHKKENEQNFENSEYQGYHGYGMPFPNSYMYPYNMMQQPQHKKDDQGSWNRKNFGQ